ncbi:MAG: glycosyltransferase family 4 protein [Desulfomonile tiedjei]|nr:glycosyltransferase family 4 protein [Desulfomonile tiedjei]
MERVLMVGPIPPPFGGIASIMDDLVHSSLQEDYDIKIFERIPSESFPPYARGLIRANIFRFKRFWRFFKELRRGNYRLVHIHSSDTAEFLGTTIFMILARVARVRVLLHIQGGDWDEFYTYNSLFRKLYTRVGLYVPEAIVVLWSMWVDKIKEMYPAANVRVIRNLLHDQEPPDASEVERLRGDLGLSKEDFVVVSVGAVGWRKGTFEILKAIPQIVSEEDSIRFVLVGGEGKPGEMAQLKQIIESEKLERWVHLTGEVERDTVPLYLALADLFILPSFIEAMPVSIIEAMRSGLPVISTRVQGIPDTVTDRVTGILIDPGNPQQIAENVLLLKGDDELRMKMAEEGKRLFCERFEFSRGIEELRGLYKEMISSSAK